MDAAETDRPAEPPLSLQRLKAAFARMMTPAGGPLEGAPEEPTAVAVADAASDESVSLSAILEAVLFVAAEGGRPRSGEEMAAALRDVSPEEIADAVVQLNEQYRRDAAPFHIEANPAGYRLCLDEDLSRLREKFHGRVREARLTPAALEVLSVVAYRQPITGPAIDKLRDARSGTLLAGLVRRRLVRFDQDGPGGKRYRTTGRFLKLFRLGDLDQLPRAAELD